MFMKKQFNLYLTAVGNLVTDWKKMKSHCVNTIAVHSGTKTDFVDLICKPEKIKGKKGSYVEVYGTPFINTYKLKDGTIKSNFKIFVSEVYFNE